MGTIVYEMATTQTTPTTTKNLDLEFRGTLERLASLIVLCSLLAVVGVYVAAPFLAYTWAQLPYMGGFVEPTLIFNGVGDPGWALLAEGVQTAYPDRLISVGGVEVGTTAELNRLMAGHSVGDTAEIVIERASGDSAFGPFKVDGQTVVNVTLTNFGFSSLVNFFVIPYFIGFLFLVIGLWVFYLRRDEASGRAFALFCASMAVIIGGLFDLYTTRIFASLWTACIPLAAASLLNLALVFPQEASYVARWPLSRWIGFLPAMVMVVIGVAKINDLSNPRDYAGVWVLGYVYMALGALYFIANNIYRWWRAKSPTIREQSRIIIQFSAGAFLPASFWAFATGLFKANWTFTPLLFLPMLLFPFGIAWAILRYRLLNTQIILSRGLVYILLGVLTTLGYGLLVAGVSWLVGSRVPANSPTLIGLLVLFLVVGLAPARSWLQIQVDALLLRGNRAYREHLNTFSRALTESAELPFIAKQLRQQVDVVVRPAHIYLFLRDANQTDYGAYNAEGRPETDLRFTMDSALTRTLASQRLLYLAPDSPLPISLQRDRGKLGVLGSPLFVSLNSKNGLIGWLSLGGRLSGEPYSRQDLEFLESLADQSALAVERAQAVTVLEKRVKELNVLSQVSQAINFSIKFDDLLELIFAQTSRVLDTRNFSIILSEPRTRSLSYAFFVENNDRQTSQEKQPWPQGVGLASEIIRSGQPILTADYLDECARRRVPPLNRPYHAWMGVPLNASARTLGVMSVASLEVGRVFTEEQLKIFSAIADQAATAIDKARLYQQTDQRAKQLATLNQVAQTITSTLELEPLLQRVLESAVDILGCEAGSLFLIDEETTDSIFKVAVGPAATDLIGLRVPAGRGIVGSTAESGQPVIVNDTASDPRWYQKADKQTGFISRAVMAVPLRVKERIIGVIEVINKRDGSPFDDEDVSLLTAFGGQAAVSIENARLFSLTDKALEARVEELSAMQKIDRELNTALDMKRAMTVVLERALSRTAADAGLAGMVTAEGMLIVAHEGYDKAIAPYLDIPLPLNTGLLAVIMNSNEAAQAADVQSDESALRILPEAVSQLAIPIRREEETIGAILLESRQPDAFSGDISFLSRLADHAAIAVANARLFNEVRAANQAKSEFVSFISHELNQPMTSIKGYADLMAAGAMGPLNDFQQQPMGVIRGNVDRMITIIKDLSDIARIESGRMKLESKVMPFQAVIDDVVRTLQGQIDAKEQKLIMEVEPDLPLVWGDHLRLVQVLTNLMSNSYKYTQPEGTIRLIIQRSANTWDPQGAPEVLHIAVQDNGYGISPADQKKIFSKYFRAEDRAIREAPGTGLGLNIFKLLVELGGGRAWFESDLGKGSTFHFTVPLASAVEPA
ncbi:MAG: GAF domain-containing protein [Chloroflexi bacterium]|nr:GAF domain-containing protein [Chloroflexota bacterium]